LPNILIFVLPINTSEPDRKLVGTSKMLNLALRIIAIAVCLGGIVECAHISKEVLRDNVDKPFTFPHLQAKAKAKANGRGTKHKRVTWQGINSNGDEAAATMLAELIRTFATVLNATLKGPFVKSASAKRLRKYARWTASRTQIHPAIA